MPLQCRCRRSDFRLQLLELPSLRELRVAPGGENFVDALVVAAADVPNELAKHFGILDGQCCSLAHSR